MPAIWRVVLAEGDYRRILPHHLHAALCSLLGETDEHHAQRKDWACGPVAGDGHYVFLSIRTLSDQRAEQLFQRARVGTSVVLGSHETMIVRVPELVSSATWSELATPTSTMHWDVDFLSPTAISVGRRFSPMITPTALIGSLSRRWESATDAWLPRFTQEEAAKVWVAALRGRTVIERIPHGRRGMADKVIPGFVGQMTLRTDDRMVAAATDCLLRFAQFSGVGVGVNHGYGTVMVKPAPAGPFMCDTPGRLVRHRKPVFA
ncbi:MAG: CRISPR system precrRNA processing endoribonuclease RAMP protein Cas6 [Propionibacteriaceae bacterium]|jgi:hypothetical protein|nr:CRISPR system precrRNA processing endoribonuclease RAMP protein Cas6 [Propionibacteriaceae bacterium]